MNHRRAIASLMVTVTLLAGSWHVTALAGDDASKTGEEVASVLRDRHAPAKALKIFKSLRGSYKQAIKWWAEPGAEPSEDTSMAKPSWLYGGRMLIQEVKGQWLGFDFKGQATIAHDNGTEEFVLSWVDSFHSGIVTARGKFDGTSDTLTLDGSYFDVVSDQERAIKIVMKLEGKKGDANIEVFDVTNSSEPVKFIEIESRKFLPRGA